jgi:hypothetical protein
MKHFHYCPKCHASPPCEKNECVIIGTTLAGGAVRPYSKHATCAACDVMALAETAPAQVNPLTAEWFDVYNGIKNR